MSLALLSQVMLLCVALVCVAVSLHKDACCLHGACLRAAAAWCQSGLHLPVGCLPTVFVVDCHQLQMPSAVGLICFHV